MAIRFAKLVLVIIAAASWVTVAMAQSAATGALAGTITDQSGAVIPHASVRVTNAGTGITRAADTDAGGFYKILSLPPGKYSTVVAATGFKSENFPDVNINVAETRTLNVNMQVGVSGESVTVEGAAAQVQTESATLGSVVGEQTVRGGLG